MGEPYFVISKILDGLGHMRGVKKKKIWTALAARGELKYSRVSVDHQRRYNEGGKSLLRKSQIYLNNLEFNRLKGGGGV